MSIANQQIASLRHVHSRSCARTEPSWHALLMVFAVALVAFRAFGCLLPCQDAPEGTMNGSAHVCALRADTSVQGDQLSAALAGQPAHALCSHVLCHEALVLPAFVVLVTGVAVALLQMLPGIVQRSLSIPPLAPPPQARLH